MTAENYAQMVSRRYPAEAWPYWFLFCKQTGHGDVAAARKFVDEFIKPINEQPELAEPAPIGYYYWLCDDPKTAMLWFRNAYAKTPSAFTCLNLITLGDEMGDSATRDEAIRILLSRFRRPAPVACEIYEILRKSLNDGKPESVDLNAIDEILDRSVPVSRSLNAYHVGLFLKNHGKAEDARRYLKLALDLPGNQEWGRAKASVVLHPG